MQGLHPCPPPLLESTRTQFISMANIISYMVLMRNSFGCGPWGWVYFGNLRLTFPLPPRGKRGEGGKTGMNRSSGHFYPQQLKKTYICWHLKTELIFQNSNCPINVQKETLLKNLTSFHCRNHIYGTKLTVSSLPAVPWPYAVNVSRGFLVTLPP